jgi:hypothetical protein
MPAHDLLTTRAAAERLGLRRPALLKRIQRARLASGHPDRVRVALSGGLTAIRSGARGWWIRIPR